MNTLHRLYFIAATCAACTTLPSPLLANDSEAEIAVGGLTLVESKDISMDREDLYISEAEVRVSYEFTNTSNKDISTTVAFPLPDLPIADSEEGMMVDFAGQLKFHTTVDGVEARLELIEQAMFADEDISGELKASGVPLNAAEPAFSAAINKLTTTARQKLVGRGLIENTGSDGSPLWTAHWTLKTAVTRHQVFPAGKTVKVEHRYVPLAGGSVAGTLEPSYRAEEWAKEQIRKYCIEDSWLSAFDQKRSMIKDGTAGYSELWLGYVLSSGANWKGPIKDFRMVIDKDDPKNLVSFCADGVKKISPTQFEVRKTNFEPKADVNVLLIKWAQP